VRIQSVQISMGAYLGEKGGEPLPEQRDTPLGIQRPKWSAWWAGVCVGVGVGANGSLMCGCVEDCGEGRGGRDPKAV